MLYAFLLDSRHEWWDEVVVSPQDDLLPSLAVRRVDRYHVGVARFARFIYRVTRD
jgi:hypothetical protein